VPSAGAESPQTLFLVIEAGEFAPARERRNLWVDTMKVKQVVWSVAVASALFVAGPCKANTVYNVDLTGFGGSIVGTIVTDGTIGAIKDSNLVSYSLTLSEGSYSALITGSQPSSSSNLNGISWASTTSAGGLYFDFGPGSQYFFLGDPGASSPSWVCFTGSGSGCGHGDIEMRINGSPLFESGSFYQGSTEIGQAPLPAALPLFATGVAGLGLLGWRRKRKAQAVA
jgi:hypothetical protein